MFSFARGKSQQMKAVTELEVIQADQPENTDPVQLATEETVPFDFYEVPVQSNTDITQNTAEIPVPVPPPKKSIFRRRYGPLSHLREYLAKRRFIRENRYLKNEEQMKQDIERYQMEIEERHTWLAYELRARNYTQMVTDTKLATVLNRQKAIEESRKVESEQEAGLSYFHGIVRSHRRPENSPAKYQDLTGHIGAVLSCKLSSCLQFVLSSGVDKTVRLWMIRSGKCVRTYTGHTKRVNDCEFHPSFELDSSEPCIMSCSGDGTLRLWNATAETFLKTIRGHSEAVLRCSFSPDGRRILSCSEDQTIRTWCFPDGYILHIYRGHSTSVTTVTFSPTGRYILSGSDYGERKLLLWDANRPLMENPAQFPHMLVWSKDGLVTKILIRRMKPHPTFWLTVDEMSQLDDTQEVDLWPAEKMHTETPDSDDDSDSDVDAEGEDIMKEDEDILFHKGDVLECRGVMLSVVHTDRYGEQDEAKEYIPGGFLVIVLQTVSKPIAEAFLTVCSKDSLYDPFVPSSGQRLGTFRVDAPVPWKEAVVDPLGIRRPYRIVPTGLSETASKHACVYKEERRFNEFGEEMYAPDTVDVVWFCPGPEFGSAVVTVNFRLRNERTWHKLQHSLRESPIRISSDVNSVSVFAKGEGANMFKFDQEARHESFWSFVRNCDWDAVRMLLDKKCILYVGETPHVVPKRRRVVRCLKEIFVDTCGFVLPKPFIHKPGTTRCAIMIEDTAVPNLDLLQTAMPTPVEKKKINENSEGKVDDTKSSLKPAAAAASSLSTTHGGDSNGGDKSSNVNVNNVHTNVNVNPPHTLDNKSSAVTKDVAVATGSGTIAGTGGLGVSSLLVGSERETQTQTQTRPSVSEAGTASAKMNFLRRFNKKNRRTSNIDPVSPFLGRNKSKPQELPQIIFKNESGIDGKFKSQVDRLVKVQFSRTQAMRKSKKYSELIEEEVRAIGSDPRRAAAILGNPVIREQLPDWLIEELERTQKQHKNLPIVDPTKSLLSKSTIPEYYPKNAGLAGSALNNKLADLKKAKRRLLESRLPVAEDVRLGIIGRWRRRRKEKAVFDATINTEKQSRDLNYLEGQVALQLLKDRSYLAGRRMAWAELPGLVPHYPNELYVDRSTADARGAGWDEDDGTVRVPTIWQRITGGKLPDPIPKPVGRKMPAAAVEEEDEQSVLPATATNFESPTVWQRLTGRSIATQAGIKNDVPNDLLNPAADGTVNNNHPVNVNDNNIGDAAIPNEEKNGDKSKSIPLFLPRRGSFPGALGLQSFQELLSQDPPPVTATATGGVQTHTHTHTSGDAITNSNTITDRAALVDNRKKKNQDLIQRFTSHGMELAHQGIVHDASFSPSENRIASAGGDCLIKLWDPRDGTFVFALQGHKAAVTAVRFSRKDEMCLISASDDRELLLWELSSKTVVRRLCGHADVIYGLAVSADLGVAATASHDGMVKTWFLCPRKPDPPDAPKIVAKSDTTVALNWIAPPSFNEPLTAFHLQWRFGLRQPWTPDTGLDIPPHYRSKVVRDLFPSSSYQFRLRAENKVGVSEWGLPSALVTTGEGLPKAPERPFAISRAKSENGPVLTVLMWLVADPNSDGGGDGGVATMFTIDKIGIADAAADSESESESHQAISAKDAAINGNALFEVWNGFKLESADEAYIKSVKKQTAARKTRQRITSAAAVPATRKRSLAQQTLAVTPVVLPRALQKKLNDTRADTATGMTGRGGFLLRAVTVDNLAPGSKYRFRVRGSNSAGDGMWSSPSYTVAVPPVEPETPLPPVPVARTLTSVTFRWEVPPDGGAAIDGYKLLLSHRPDKTIILDRYQTTYLCSGLRPGKVYRAQVQARNCVGWSPISDLSDETMGVTLTAAPDEPFAPRPVNATTNSLHFELVLPYGHGCVVDMVVVEVREVSAFAIGEWGLQRRFRIPSEQVETLSLGAVNRVSHDVKLEGKSSDGEENVQRRISLGGNIIISKNKKDGDGDEEEEIPTKIRYWIDQLNANTIYETRVFVENKAGASPTSRVSHRAKTNREVLQQVPHNSH